MPRECARRGPAASQYRHGRRSIGDGVVSSLNERKSTASATIDPRPPQVPSRRESDAIRHLPDPDTSPHRSTTSSDAHMCGIGPGAVVGKTLRTTVPTQAANGRVAWHQRSVTRNHLTESTRSNSPSIERDFSAGQTCLFGVAGLEASTDEHYRSAIRPVAVSSGFGQRGFLQVQEPTDEALSSASLS
jgi:hypothetical protein